MLVATLELVVLALITRLVFLVGQGLAAAAVAVPVEITTALQMAAAAAAVWAFTGRDQMALADHIPAAGPVGVLAEPQEKRLTLVLIL